MYVEKILLVDDDANLLAGLRRQLTQTYNVTTAEGGAEALDKIAKEGPFAVAVCDMRMPGMSGLELLGQLRERAPNISRIMLTGNADQKTAVDAVNDGQILRFLNKPCALDSLQGAINAGIRQYRLVNAERSLIEGTLAGSIALLSEVLSLAAPESFERSLRLRGWAAKLVEEMKAEDTWVLDLAATLAPIGEVAIPSEILARHRARQPLNEAEAEMIARIPETGASLIRRIPRLESVAEAVRYQAKWYDEGPRPGFEKTGADIPFQARILRVLTALDEAGEGRLTRRALASLEKTPERFDPSVLATALRALKGLSEDDTGATLMQVPASGLMPGDQLDMDLKLADGRLVLAAGQAITSPLFLKVKNLRSMYKFEEPIRVRRSGSRY